MIVGVAAEAVKIAFCVVRLVVRVRVVTIANAVAGTLLTLFASIVLGIKVEMLLFHEGDKLMESVVGVVETVAGGFETKLPFGEHETEEGILHFGTVSTIEFVAVRARKVNADFIE